MMLCNEDLTDKHLRVFKMDCDEGTIEWAKDVGLTRGRLMLPTKGPFSLIAAKEVSGGILELTTTAQPLWIKPPPGAEYRAWLECCNSVVTKNTGIGIKQSMEAALTKFEGTLGPCPMMLCQANLKDKHERVVMLNCDELTVEWSEEWAGSWSAVQRIGGKGPFVLIGVKEVQRAVTSVDGAIRVLELQTSGETCWDSKRRFSNFVLFLFKHCAKQKQKRTKDCSNKD